MIEDTADIHQDIADIKAMLVNNAKSQIAPPIQQQTQNSASPAEKSQLASQSRQLQTASLVQQHQQLAPPVQQFHQMPKSYLEAFQSTLCPFIGEHKRRTTLQSESTYNNNAGFHRNNRNLQQNRQKPENIIGTRIMQNGEENTLAGDPRRLDIYVGKCNLSTTALIEIF